MSDKSREPEVRFHNPMPAGYVFVPKGDVYITLNVRKRTHASENTLYVVLDKNKHPIGLRCPAEIYEHVKHDAEATKARREQAVESRDAVVKDGFEAELLRLFPKAPKADVEQILKRTLQKRKRRVGRTATLDLDAKVQLAVKAHIRHCHTDYDSLLRSNTSKEKARRMISPEVEKVARSWMSDLLKVSRKEIKATKRRLKRLQSQAGPSKRVALGRSCTNPTKMPSGTGRGSEVIVISDDSDEEDNGAEPFIYRDDSIDSDWEP